MFQLTPRDYNLNNIHTAYGLHEFVCYTVFQFQMETLAWEGYKKKDCMVQYSLVHGLEGSSKVFGIKPTRGVESVGSMKT